MVGRARRLGVELDDAAVFGHRLVEPAHGSASTCPTGSGPGPPWVRVRRHGGIRPSPRRLATCLQAQAETGVGRASLGVKFDRSPVGPHRLVHLPSQGHADLVMDHAHRRPRRQGGPVEAHRLRRLPLPQRLAQRTVEPEVLRVPACAARSSGSARPSCCPSFFASSVTREVGGPSRVYSLARRSCASAARRRSASLSPHSAGARKRSPHRGSGSVRCARPSSRAINSPVAQRVGDIGPVVQGHHQCGTQVGGADPGRHGLLVAPDVQAALLEGARVGFGHAAIIEAAALDSRGQPDPLQPGRQPEVLVRPGQPTPQVVRAGLVHAAPDLREDRLRLPPAAFSPQARELCQGRLDRLPRPPLLFGLLSLQPQPTADCQDEQRRKRRQQPRRRRLRRAQRHNRPTGLWGASPDRPSLAEAIQVVGQRRGAGVATLRLLVQAFQADRLQVARHCGFRREGGTGSSSMTCRTSQRGLAAERRPPGEHLVEDGAQGIDVGGRPDVPPCRRPARGPCSWACRSESPLWVWPALRRAAWPGRSR